jgi:hypothetical protein
VGIVQVVEDHQKEVYRQTGEAEYKYYIGIGFGKDEKADSTYIRDYGTKFDTNAGNALFRVRPPLKTDWK